MATSSFAVREHPTKVKVLNGLTIFCEHQGCEMPAGYLFRTGGGPIAAYCQQHAQEKAPRLGVTLPESVEKALTAGW
jgi:hypothetical protein